MIAIFPSDPNPSALCYTVIYPGMHINQQLCTAEIQGEESSWSVSNNRNQIFQCLKIRTSSKTGGVLMARVNKDLKRPLPMSRHKQIAWNKNDNHFLFSFEVLKEGQPESINLRDILFHMPFSKVIRFVQGILVLNVYTDSPCCTFKNMGLPLWTVWNQDIVFFTDSFWSLDWGFKEITSKVC